MINLYNKEKQIDALFEKIAHSIHKITRTFHPEKEMDKV